VKPNFEPHFNDLGQFLRNKGSELSKNVVCERR